MTPANAARLLAELDRETPLPEPVAEPPPKSSGRPISELERDYLAENGIKARPGVYDGYEPSKRQTELEAAIQESDRLKAQLGPEAWRLYQAGKLTDRDVAEVIEARAGAA